MANGKNIILVGVGGQGTILTTKILSAGLTELGYDVKMSEIHGMSQRGGTVTTQLKYGDKVYAPNIGDGEADVIVGFEKSEAARAIPYLRIGGTVIADEREIYSMPVLTGAAEYPHGILDDLKKTVGEDHVKVIDAFAKAEELGNTRVQNIVLLGALVKVLGIEGIDWVELVGKMVPAKVRDLNIEAYKQGFAMV
ncbi:MAG: indolepyruvate oxidoreductase subunit beta [Eubacteriaceae bacterium]|jgi:indolepyruvate ferredoxin oxidoreductase beta subunit|nr:indolepyruvate oxidoreductase subunit beta [Eubacteriaceae bacterium]